LQALIRACPALIHRASCDRQSQAREIVVVYLGAPCDCDVGLTVPKICEW
jgi:hypothetical protein